MPWEDYNVYLEWTSLLTTWKFDTYLPKSYFFIFYIVGNRSKKFLLSMFMLLTVITKYIFPRLKTKPLHIQRTEQTVVQNNSQNTNHKLVKMKNPEFAYKVHKIIRAQRGFEFKLKSVSRTHRKCGLKRTSIKQRQVT